MKLMLDCLIALLIQFHKGAVWDNLHTAVICRMHIRQIKKKMHLLMLFYAANPILRTFFRY